jgi:hypothetical protein
MGHEDKTAPDQIAMAARRDYTARSPTCIQLGVGRATVEWIVEEVPWSPERAARKGAETVGVRVDFQEVSLQRQVKQAGGRWNPARRVWELRRDQALKLGLKDRIENAKVSINRKN